MRKNKINYYSSPRDVVIKFEDDIEAHLPPLFEMLLDPVELAVGGELGLVRGEGGGVLSSRPHHSSIINLLAANMLYLRTDCTAKTRYRIKTNIPRRGIALLCPNFYIHVSVSNLYIPKIGLPILFKKICGPILGIYTRKSLTDT